MGNNPPSPLEDDYNSKFNSDEQSTKAALQHAKDCGYNNIVELKLATWSRESHGLFDYENKNTMKKL